MSDRLPTEKIPRFDPNSKPERRSGPGVRAVVLVGSGDRETVGRTAEAVQRTGPDGIVETALLNGPPSLAAAVRACLEKGAHRIVVVPCFIHLEETVRQDLEKELESVRKARPDIDLLLAAPVGFDPRLSEILRDRVEQARARLEGTDGLPILNIEGRVETPVSFSYAEFCRLPGQIPDVGRIAPGRRGAGIYVRALLERASPAPDARRAVFHAPGFSAGVSLAQVAEAGFLIYELDGQPLPASQGGPLRLLVPGIDDRCANVKGVVRIEITAETG